MTEAAGPAPARFKVGKWGALGILMVLAFLNYMDRNLIIPLQDLIAKDLDLTTTQLGMLTTGFHFVYMCTAPLVGAISDRVVRKTVLLTALVSWSLITALSGTATGFISLLFWRALTGLGEGGYFPTAVSLIGDLFPANRRGLALALHGVCTALGGSTGYAVGGILGQRLGWRTPFLMAIIPGLLLAFVLYRSFDEPPRGTKAKDANATRRSWLAIVTSPAVLMIAVSAGFGSFAMNGINTFLPLFLTRERHVSVSDAGILTGAFYLAAIVGQLVGGLLADRLSSVLRGVRPAFVALPYLLAAPALFVVTRSSAVMLALVCYGFTQLLRGFAEPNIYGTVIDSTPADERGSAQGFLLMISFLGATSAGVALGAMIDARGFGPAFDLVASASLAAGTLAAVLSIYVRRRIAT